jgi:hypothetical protein
MTSYFLAALAAVMLLVSGAAHAVSFTPIGIIKSIDRSAHAITLGSGQVLTLRLSKK